MGAWGMISRLGSLALCALAGCGAPKSAPLADGAPVVATPEAGKVGPMGTAASTDTVVARVSGLPVYASCVEHQAATRAADRAGDEAAARRAALDECIGFELLAQEAAARKLTADPEVAEARRAAAVSRLVELEIDDKVQTAAQLPAAFTARVMERNRWRLHRVEYRASAFVRFKVPTDEPQGTAADLAAHAAADRLAQALAGERGLFPDHLSAKAHEVAQGQPIEEGAVDLTDASRLVPTYSAALFAIAEIGRTSPAVRTQWGWDVLLWTKQLPPRDISEAELANELFPEMRLAYFNAWSKAAGKGVNVQVNPDAGQLLSRHVDETETGPPALSPAPTMAPSAPQTPASSASPASPASPAAAETRP
jgi:hypothetical protein